MHTYLYNDRIKILNALKRRDFVWIAPKMLLFTLDSNDGVEIPIADARNGGFVLLKRLSQAFKNIWKQINVPDKNSLNFLSGKLPKSGIFIFAID